MGVYKKKIGISVTWGLKIQSNNLVMKFVGFYSKDIFSSL